MDEFELALEETVEKLKHLESIGIKYISVAPPPVAVPSNALTALNKKIHSCTKCKRHEGREKAALGIGSEDARVVFVSTLAVGTPAVGTPTVGVPTKDTPAAGKAASRRSSGEDIGQAEVFTEAEKELLLNIIKAMGLSAGEVYMTSLVRCAGDYAPTSVAVDACLPFLKDELEIINPVAVVAMGEAASYLVATDVEFANLRGIMRSFDDIPLMITHHPSALIKDPALKREAWEDMKKVMALL